jgi:protein subunit release factor B
MSPRVLLVTAGTGPVEVRRFVALLAAHLVDRCAERGASVREVVVHGDEAEPSSVEVHLSAAPGSIEALAGTHALVARSADRGKRSRKRWYAGVQISEAAGESCEPREPREPRESRESRESREAAGPREASIKRSDVTITAMRAGGPGGQHVNKTASAVRVFHPASGISVRVSDERSQRDNVRIALLRLEEILAQRAEERASGARAARRLHYRVERGRPAFVYETDRKGGLCLCEETCSR